MKNKILIFKGGGYDGCFWEWNALIFQDGKLVEECVSGRYGKHAVELVETLGAFRAIREMICNGVGDYYKSECSPFLVRNEIQWEYACKEWNSGFIRNLALKAGLKVRCDSCGGMFPAEEIRHTGYKGDGGVGICYTDNKCYECAENEHEEFIRKYEWPRLKLSKRVEAIHRAQRDGLEVSIFAARRDEMPAIDGRHVYEPEYY